jgi:carboxyl-terminal processing protease
MIQISRYRKIAIAASIAAVGFFSFKAADNYFEISKNLEIFTSVYRELNTYYVDDTKPGQLMKTGIDAMLRSLDPYTVYYPESKVEDFTFMTTGQYGGIGALINTVEGKVTVAEPYENYPAAKAGLMAGDVILKVDGKSVDGKNQEEISSFLKGQPGTEVTITYQRPGSSESKTAKLVREEVKIPDVPYFGMVDSEIGYVKLNSFTQTASAEVRKAMKELKETHGMKKLMLDLRGNGGGLLKEAVNIVNFFVPKGTEVVRTKGKIEEWNKIHNALYDPFDLQMPVVILVDEMSASASEIVAGAIQDLDRGVVIGQSTFGKGLVQQTKDISYNTKLKLTVAKYYIPSGRCIQRLDYGARDEFGMAGQVPDSLVKTFYTKANRPVTDGRGIEPDVKVEPAEYSNLLHGIMTNNLIFHYATVYRQKNQQISEPGTFRLSDSEYRDFSNFVLERRFEYNTNTEMFFAELERIAKEEKYFDTASNEFAILKSRIEPKKEEDLVRFEDEIRDVLENEIVSRYFYQSGRLRYNLQADPVVLKARDVLNNGYSDILRGKR